MNDLIAANLHDLRIGIAEACNRCGRDPTEITILAVTKTHPTETIRQAVSLGLSEIGESRVQEAEAKLLELGPIARYHLVGHLQTNKVKKAVQLFDVIQSVDSLRLAEEISRRAGEVGRTLDCCIEINSSGETQKYGVNPDHALGLVESLISLSHIKLCGFMTVGPLTSDENDIRIAFRTCRDLFGQARGTAGDQFGILSMGMSDDYRIAIEEGSTMLRIGTGLFGPRQL
ncbi:MAG: YggS family pyridoxal phosphate-dependent enzyme [Candidatus Zixiibacteriota bacterium]